MRIYLIFVYVLMLNSTSFSQEIIRNLGSTSLISGCGALINLKSGENGFEVFLKGAAKGCLGGALNYGSKELMYKYSLTGDWGWAWSSKLCNELSTSIIENAASNDKFLSTWHFTVGFNRMEMNLSGKPKLEYKIMPFSLLSTVSLAVNHARFRPELLLKTGHVFFSRDPVDFNYQFLGKSIANNAVIDPGFVKANFLQAHEIIHIYQHNYFGVLNSLFNKPRNKWSNKYRLVNSYTKGVYTDLNFPVFVGAYNINSKFFEREADYYSLPR